MYRRQGSLGVLQGVLSGPYTGGPRRVDAAKLPRAVKQRLSDALGGRSEPSPIAYERTGGAGAHTKAASWGFLVALVAFILLFAVGFGDARSRWALQDFGSALPIYVAVTALFSASLVVLLRRYALASGHELPPGRYLLPLDVLEVPRVDRRGRQVLTVTPLGDARDAIARALGANGGRRREIVIVLEGGAEIRFVVRSEAVSGLAMLRLEHSQRLLEEVTYQRGLDKAFAFDPLFEVRVDGSWADVAPSGEGAPGGVRRALLHGPFAWGIAAAAAVGLAMGGLAARNRLSDRALFLRAVSAATPEAFDAYLARGRAYRADAEVLRRRLLAAREAAAQPAREPGVSDEEMARASKQCSAALAENPSWAHPETLSIVDSLLARAAEAHEPLVPVSFTRTLAPRPPGVPPLDFDAREERLVRAFERIFSETCPASAIRFVRSPRSVHGGGLDVDYVVTWPSELRSPRGDVIQGMRVVFDVTLRGTGQDDAARFHLTMPPPKEPSMALRPRSLFALAGAPPAAGVFDDRVYDVMTARAFDRLYDEIYGLFFEGDPRVPLREEPAADPAAPAPATPPSPASPRP
jgi:hypothetical protein